MLDAVIDEIDGRQIRVGDQWLTDYASCNYLGLDLDEDTRKLIQSEVNRIREFARLARNAAAEDGPRATLQPIILEYFG